MSASSLRTPITSLLPTPRETDPWWDTVLEYCTFAAGVELLFALSLSVLSATHCSALPAGSARDYEEALCASGESPDTTNELVLVLVAQIVAGVGARELWEVLGNRRLRVLLHDLRDAARGVKPGGAGEEPWAVRVAAAVTRTSLRELAPGRTGGRARFRRWYAASTAAALLAFAGVTLASALTVSVDGSSEFDCGGGVSCFSGAAESSAAVAAINYAVLAAAFAALAVRVWRLCVAADGAALADDRVFALARLFRSYPHLRPSQPACGGAACAAYRAVALPLLGGVDGAAEEPAPLLAAADGGVGDLRWWLREWRAHVAAGAAVSATNEHKAGAGCRLFLSSQDRAAKFASDDFYIERLPREAAGAVPHRFLLDILASEVPGQSAAAEPRMSARAARALATAKAVSRACAGVVHEWKALQATAGSGRAAKEVLLWLERYVNSQGRDLNNSASFDVVYALRLAARESLPAGQRWARRLDAARRSNADAERFLGLSDDADHGAGWYPSGARADHSDSDDDEKAAAEV